MVRLLSYVYHVVVGPAPLLNVPKLRTVSRNDMHLFGHSSGLVFSIPGKLLTTMLVFTHNVERIRRCSKCGIKSWRTPKVVKSFVKTKLWYCNFNLDPVSRISNWPQPECLKPCQAGLPQPDRLPIASIPSRTSQFR